MKRNSILLVLISLVLGAMIALGTSRMNARGKLDSCVYIGTGGAKSTLVDQAPSVRVCGAQQLGYPYKYLHSQIFVTQNSDNTTYLTAKPWVEFKPAVGDWLIWSVVSACGLGLLIYAMEKAGNSTGFISKSSKRRR